VTAAEDDLAAGLAAGLAARLVALHGALRERGATVAVAESLTGGLLAATLTETPGASRTFRGGLVVYATELKAALAGVPQPLLAAQGPVSPDVAAALAGGARDRLGATYGLGLTGVAGPDPQNGVPVGTVYLGLASPRGGKVRKLALSGDRAAIRTGAVSAAVGLLIEELDGAAESSTQVSGEVRESPS
jgi:nicotinamide-nucleotide amidase